MSTPELPAQRKKLPLFKLAAMAAVVLVAAVLVVSGGDVHGLIVQAKALGAHVVGTISAAGPTVFFIALALLPAVGVPVLPFILVAGSAFGARLGMMSVVLLSMMAVTVNMVLTYFLARRAVRPLLEKLIVRLDYKVPEVPAGDATELIIILRLTPGIPYCVQNYLLGLANAPFGKFFFLSSALSLPQNAAFVLFGNALLEGKGETLLKAGGLVVALVAGTHLLRKHYSRKKAVA